METKQAESHPEIDRKPLPNTEKRHYVKPESKTHEPLEVISKWQDQSSNLPGI